jgi:hypothetical protein
MYPESLTCQLPEGPTDSLSAPGVPPMLTFPLSTIVEFVKEVAVSVYVAVLVAVDVRVYVYAFGTTLLLPVNVPVPELVLVKDGMKHGSSVPSARDLGVVWAPHDSEPSSG